MTCDRTAHRAQPAAPSLNVNRLDRDLCAETDPTGMDIPRLCCCDGRTTLPPCSGASSQVCHINVGLRRYRASDRYSRPPTLKQRPAASIFHGVFRAEGTPKGGWVDLIDDQRTTGCRRSSTQSHAMGDPLIVDCRMTKAQYDARLNDSGRQIPPAPSFPW